MTRSNHGQGNSPSESIENWLCWADATPSTAATMQWTKIMICEEEGNTNRDYGQGLCRWGTDFEFKVSICTY